MDMFLDYFFKAVETGLDIPILAFIVFILTNILKKIIPSIKSGLVAITPFVLGVLLYLTLGFFVIKTYTFTNCLYSGLRVGGIATLYYAIFKQVFLKSENISKIISNILKGIVSSSSISKTTENILKELKLGEDSATTAKAIYNVLAGSTSLSDLECNAITSLVIKAFTENQTKK